MEFIRLTQENLEQEHICCAIAGAKDPQVVAKKDWLRQRFDEGLVFLKGDVRGKCFIEYLPAEAAWSPIEAAGYTFIDCFWISGQFKGQGYANDLLDACIRDSQAQGRVGLCVVSSPKKLPFLSDPGYLTYKGFRPADTAQPYFSLLYLPFREDAPQPRFADQVREPHISSPGFVAYYSNGCPYPAKYVPLLAAVAEQAQLPFQSIRLDSRQAAQSCPAAWCNFALFYNGRFVTHELPSEKKFLKLAEDLTAGKDNEKR